MFCVCVCVIVNHLIVYWILLCHPNVHLLSRMATYECLSLPSCIETCCIPPTLMLFFVFIPILKVIRTTTPQITHLQKKIVCRSQNNKFLLYQISKVVHIFILCKWHKQYTALFWMIFLDKQLQRGGEIHPSKHTGISKRQVVVSALRKEVQGAGICTEAHIQQAFGESWGSEERGRNLNDLLEEVLAQTVFLTYAANTGIYIVFVQG